MTEFELGNRWQAHGGGAPELGQSLVGTGEDGSSLRMGSSAGTGGEVVGIEKINRISLAGVRLLRVTARLRPLNQTGGGNGGASDASAGIAVIGVSGAYTRASAGANRPSPPDWGDFYSDSEHSLDGNSAGFAHFPPNDPAGGAESFRTFVLELSADGTSLTTLSSTGQPLAVTPFDVLNSNLTLAAFGDSVTIALFQQRSDSSIAPENTYGDFDSVRVETELLPNAETDGDGDGILDTYERANGLSPTVNDAGLDLDSDGLSNLTEFQRGTAANNPDSDGDGLRDGVESASGVYVSVTDTGTNPLKADTDNDGLGDRVETNTGTFVSSTSAGTDPFRTDTDGDGFGDGLEVGAGFDPTQAANTPAGIATIRTAVEFQFFAAPGVSYRIEASEDLQNWTTVEATIIGAGLRVGRLYSTETKPHRGFRAVAN